MKRFSIIMFAVLLLAGAAVHGAITQRFSAFAPDASCRDRMHALIVKFEDCEAKPIEHDVPLKERSIATSKRYMSKSNSFGATTSIISGVPGAVATHTPDICYTASGYTMTRVPMRKTITLANGKQATFLYADFEKTKATQTDRVRVRWAWSTDGCWDAPDYARFAYLKTPELFKLYVVTVLPAETSEESSAVSGFVAAAFEQYAEALTK